LELGAVWKFITGQNLNGAHDSLIDAKAKTDIVIHNFFKPCDEEICKKCWEKGYDMHKKK